MTLRTGTHPRSQGFALDTSPETFGELRDSTEVATDVATLRISV